MIFKRLTILIFVFSLFGVPNSWGLREFEKLVSWTENSHSFVDKGGRKIDLKHPFKRVISLYGAHTENLFYLGLDKEVIGVSRHENYPPRALEKPIFSYHDGPEKFLSARPDLVLIRPMIDRGYPGLIKMLEQSRITVVSLQPSTVEEMYTYWKILGALTGKNQAASKMSTHFMDKVLKVRSRVKDIQPKKTVYFEAIHSRMKTFSPKAIAAFVLETAGGINAAWDAKPVRMTNIAAYGKERILAKSDEIDVFIAQNGTMNRPTISMIKNEPGFSSIKAIKNNEVFIIDEMIVSRPTIRLLQGIQKIGKILYPDVF